MNELASKIQDSELEVMRVLWEAGDALPLTEIRRVLHERRDWEDSTVKTLLRRLQDKGAVNLVSRGMYAANITQSEYSEWASNRMIEKFYHGSAKNLVASLLSCGRLTEEDIAELREYLEAISDE